MTQEEINWVCPECKKTFDTVYQWHECIKKSLDKHFLYPNPELKIIFGTLAAEIKKIGLYRIVSNKSAIYFRSNHNFLVAVTHSEYLKLEFMLPREETVFSGICRTKKRKDDLVIHHVKLYNADEVTDDLLSLIREAYHLKDSI